MTTKDEEYELLTDPWEIWPDGIIPAQGNIPALRLKTAEEGKAMFRELAEMRKKFALPEGMSIIDTIREERDAR